MEQHTEKSGTAMVPVGTLIAQISIMFLVFALLLFVPAGTLRWVAGWVFMAIFFGATIVLSIWLARANPALLKERLTGMGKADQKAWDKILISVVGLVFMAWLVVMPLDAVRYHWSHIPTWLQVVGGLLFLVSFYMIFLVYRENSYLSPAVRIQRERGQTVISTGPYRIVRHPLYASVILFFIGAALLLGSWLGILVGLLLIVLIGWRAVLEEQVLRDELPGYAEYMTRVRYRFIPHIW